MIAITGTSGFVGNALVNRIDAKFIPLTFDCGKWKMKLENSIHDPEVSELTLSKVETLIHIGSFVPQKSEDMNLWSKNYNSILSTDKLLSLNLSHLKKIIFISSSRAAAWDPMNSPKSNSQYKTIYGGAKYISEHLIQSYSIARSVYCTIIRAGSLFGPGEDKFNRLIPTLIKSALVNDPLYISDNKKIKLSFLYIEDLISCIISVATKSTQKKLINLSGREYFTLTEIANLIIDMTNSKSTIVYYSESNSIKASEVSEVSEFENFEYTNFIDGLKNEISSYL